MRYVFHTSLEVNVWPLFELVCLRHVFLPVGVLEARRELSLPPHASRWYVVICSFASLLGSIEAWVRRPYATLRSNGLSRRSHLCPSHCVVSAHAGEGTLEAQLVRLQLRSMAENDGLFDFDKFLQKYVTFMTTPGSHNDTYAGVSALMDTS